MKLQFKTNPWKHQLNALKYLMPRSFGALYTDMGTGKTKIMIDLIVNKGWKRTIIVCPKKVCRVWAVEINKHSFEGSICVINLGEVSGDKRIHFIEEQRKLHKKTTQEVILINYDSIWREPFKKYALEKYKAACVVCDESHRIKSPASKCSKFLQTLGRRVENRYLVTGTPLSQSPLDVYAQYRFLAPTIFGTSFANFKQEYANWVQVAGGFPILDKKNPYKNLDQLHEKMFSCAFLAESEVELPETQDITVEFDLSPKAEGYYKDLKKEGCLELKNGVVDATTALTLMLRLQQLTSGYLVTEDDEGTRKYLTVDDTRQEAFRDLLEGINPNESVVVFTRFRRDIKKIRRVVKDSGRKSSELSGVKDTLQNWLDGKTTVLVVQIASGSEGIDLTKARYCIYYTMTHSLGQYLQSRKRVHRPNQTRPVVYYTLVAKLKKGVSIDERIIQSLKDNKNIIDSIMEGEEI